MHHLPEFYQVAGVQGVVKYSSSALVRQHLLRAVATISLGFQRQRPTIDTDQVEAKYPQFFQTLTRPRGKEVFVLKPMVIRASCLVGYTALVAKSYHFKSGDLIAAEIVLKASLCE